MDRALACLYLCHPLYSPSVLLVMIAFSSVNLQDRQHLTSEFLRLVAYLSFLSVTHSISRAIAHPTKPQ